MATINAGIVPIVFEDPFDISNLWQSYLGARSSTSFTTSNSLGHVWQFTGVGLSYSSSAPVSGTITGLKFLSDGVTIFHVTGLSMPVPQFMLLLNAVNLSGMLQAMFSGADTMTGNDEIDYLNGYAGNDILTSHGGDDIIATGTGVDTVDGGAGSDELRLDRSNISLGLSIDLDAMATAGGITLADGSVIRNMERFKLVTGSGNDAFAFTLTNPTAPREANTINGGAGVDRVTADLSAATQAISSYLTWTNIEEVWVTGGAGNDVLTGGTGDDYLRGGAGNDTLSAGGGGVDILDGGDGFDTAAFNFDTSTEDIHLALGGVGGAEIVLPNGSIVRNIEQISIWTGTGDDTLDLGTGFIGQYSFYSTGGMNTVIADFSASSTPLHLTGQELSWGSARLNTNANAFSIAGGSGDDELRGLNDSIWHGDGDDIFNGGGGDDIIRGYGGDDQMYGGAGNDIIYVDRGADIIDGGDGVDTLVIEVTGDARGVPGIFNPADYAGIYTSDGTTLSSGASVRNMERLSVVLGWHNDVVLVAPGLTGFSIIDGDSGMDVLHGDFTGVLQSIVAKPWSLAIGGVALLSLSEVERLDFTGGSGADALTGGGYDDILKGGGGNDTLIGDYGDDLLIGGDGDDILAGNMDSDSDTSSYYGEDVLVGGAGADRLLGNWSYTTASYETSSTGVNVNLLTGIGSGGDAEGDTLVSIERLVGSAHNDVLIAGVHSDSYGFIYKNYTLIGGDGDDYLVGSGGYDVLLGGNGNDTLSGGASTDRMEGGDGDDVIVIDADESMGEVLGGAGNDVLVQVGGAPRTLLNLEAHGFERAQVWLTDTGAEAWDERADHYDAQWRLVRSNVLNDDATAVEIYFDVSNSNDWTTNWNHYAASGGRDINTVTYDDGSSDVLFLDPDNALNWTTNWNRYDAGGARTINTVTYDTGITETLHLDPHNTLNWTTNWRQLNASGQTLINTVTYDSGVSEVVYHDVAGTQNWTTNWNQYAAGGQLAINSINFDNGTSVTLHYDYANTQTWASNWNRYDTLGRLDVNSLTFDNGRYSVVDYDQANAHSWATIWSLYDAGGNLLATQTTNDDGSFYP